MSYKIIPVLLLSFCAACSKPIKTPKDLMERNLQVTSKNEQWKYINAMKASLVEKKEIGGKTVGIEEKVVYTKLPALKKTEIYDGEVLKSVGISEPSENVTVTFEDGEAIGYVKNQPEQIFVNPVLKLLKEANDLKLIDSLWKDTPAFYLIDERDNERYVFDKESYMLVAKYSPNLYGEALTTYSEYRWVDGYFIPHKEDYYIEKAQYRIVSDFQEIAINPELDEKTFDVDPNWFKVVVGKEIPEFEIPLWEHDGTTISASDLRGKTVLIDFWATWCKPCLEEFPVLQKAYSLYKGNGFEILSISFDEDGERLKKFLDNKSLPWKYIAHEQGAFKSNLARKFQLVTIPKPILVDENGVIVALDVDARGDNLLNILEKIHR